MRRRRRPRLQILHLCHLRRRGGRSQNRGGPGLLDNASGAAPTLRLGLLHGYRPPPGQADQRGPRAGGRAGGGGHVHAATPLHGLGHRLARQRPGRGLLGPADPAVALPRSHQRVGELHSNQLGCGRSGVQQLAEHDRSDGQDRLQGHLGHRLDFEDNVGQPGRRSAEPHGHHHRNNHREHLPGEGGLHQLHNLRRDRPLPGLRPRAAIPGPFRRPGDVQYGERGHRPVRGPRRMGNDGLQRGQQHGVGILAPH